MRARQLLGSDERCTPSATAKAMRSRSDSLGTSTRGPVAGREWYREDELRVVADLEPLREVGPPVVEHELALAVPLEVRRCRGHHLFVFPERHVHRQPPAIGPHAAGTSRAPRGT